MIASALGWAALLAAIGAVVLGVGRRAARHGILAPFVVGLGLRLVVMGIAHAGSLSLGDKGIFFLDDESFRQDAAVLSGAWRDGQTPDPTDYDVLGTYQVGYQLYLALIFTLGTSSVLLAKFVNVLVGGVTVYVVGRLGGEVLGERAKACAAWSAALFPTMIWWSATLMKEALATLLLALGLLAVTRLPSPRAVALLAAALAALIIVRGPGVPALAIGAGVGVAVAGYGAEGRVLSRPLIRFAVMLVAGVTVGVLLVSRGEFRAYYHHYESVLGVMFHALQGADLTRLPYDAVKSLVTPLPWAFDPGTRTWERMLYPGVWVLLCALPLAAAGAWRLRHRPEAWALIATAATSVVVYSATSGFAFRQRSMIEPLILLLALGGMTSWRMAARSAAAALGLVMVVVAVHSRSPWITLAVAGAAGALLVLARRLPSTHLEPVRESRMVAGFRESMGPDPPPAPVAARILGEITWLLRAVRRAARTVHSRTMRIAPRIAAPSLGAMARAAPALDGSDERRDGGVAVIPAAMARVAPPLDGSGERPRRST